MSARQFAFLSGAIFLLIGLLQFAPGLSSFPEWLPRLNLEVSYGLFLNVLPANIVNKVALILFGLAGLSLSRSKDSEAVSIMYARVVCIVMGVAAVLGIIPQTQTFFGYWPLFGGEVWFHGISAVIGGYFGFAKREVEIKRQTYPATPHTRVY
jgi:hypothetical protein